MKNKFENLIKEVEAILNQIVKKNIKKDFIELISGCTISFDSDIINYKKDNKLFFFYRKTNNNFYFRFNFWLDFEHKYSLNYQELSDLLVDVVEEVLNCKGITLKITYAF